MKNKEHMINYLDNAYDCLEKAQIKINELMEQEPECSVECNEYGEPEDNLDYDSNYFTLYEFLEQNAWATDEEIEEIRKEAEENC